jgi:Domain of unknown function (DUF1905)
MPANLYKMKSEVWLYPGMAGWHFVSVPKKDGKDIKKRFGKKQRGWGSLPVVVTLGKTIWKTSIFPDKHSGSYLLPLKALVRKNEGVLSGDKVSFSLEIKY